LLDMMLSYRSPDNPNETLSIEEKSVLDIALYETYRKVGITSDRQTHNRQPPLLRDLYHTLMSGDCRPEECEPEEAVIAQASEPDPVAQGLARRLRRYVYGSLSGLFSGPTNVELNNSFIVFDVKELDDELRPLALMMITNLTWNMTFASRIPRLLIIDELATLYRYRSGAKFAEEAFQRGRKQYLGIVGITQHPHLFKDSAIIANCATHILLGQDHTTIDLVSDMFKLSPREAQLLKNIKRGEGLMLVDGKRMHVKFQGSDLENSLAHTDPRELAELELEEEAPAEPLKELAVAAPGAEQINGNHQ